MPEVLETQIRTAPSLLSITEFGDPSKRTIRQRQQPRLLICRETNARLENLVIYGPCQFQYPVMVTPLYIPLAVMNAVITYLMCELYPKPLRSRQAGSLEMMGTIHAVRKLGGPPKSLLQDLFEDSSASSNESKVWLLYIPVRNVS